MTKVLLRARGLRREVGAKSIVREASFALRAGEVVAITGASGAGKSSVLRLLNRLDAPSGGQVWLDGVETGGMDVRELRRRVGMVMQQANLFPGTVAENVRYGPALRGEALTPDAVEELLRRVGLAGYAERDVAALSGARRSGCHWRGRWRIVRWCCCWTSRPRRWTMRRSWWWKRLCERRWQGWKARV